MAAEGTANHPGPAAMKIHPGTAEARQFEKIIRRPERRAKGIAHPRLAATVAGVALRHPIDEVRFTGHADDARHFPIHIAVRSEQSLGGDAGIVRRPHDIIMSAARHNPAGQHGRSFPRKTSDPLRVGTDIRPAKPRFRHAGYDRFGEGHPLRKIFVKIPVLRAQPVVGIAVKFRFIANLKKEQPFAELPGDIGCFFSVPFRRSCAEIQTVNGLPSRRL